MEKHYIPKYLHAQYQVLNWELDEVAVWLLFIFFSTMTNSLTVKTVLVLAGYLAMRSYIRLKENGQEGYMFHFLYRFGLYNVKKFPEFWIKELVK